MTTGLKLFFGTLAVVGGITYYMHRKNKAITYEKYCDNCIKMASARLDKSIDVLKSILLLIVKDEEVYPVLYTRYKSGKIYKTEFNNFTFPFSKCPDTVKDELIQKGEIIIHKY